MDCGELIVFPAKETPPPTVVLLDGRAIHMEKRPIPREELRIPMPACGVHTIEVRYPDDDDIPRIVTLGPGVVIEARTMNGWAVAQGAPACLTLDPPTFGWTCNAKAVPPDAAFDLRKCQGGWYMGSELALAAEAKDGTRLAQNFLASLPGHYTAAVDDGRIAMRWEADTAGCPPPGPPPRPTWPEVAPLQVPAPDRPTSP
ncbi:MAG: hypothetical protein Q8P18_22165 [Pseudomonadota bacterium]|nr:hypothetical protein [Pseudomonadota bacterium]